MISDNIGSLPLDGNQTWGSISEVDKNLLMSDKFTAVDFVPVDIETAQRSLLPASITRLANETDCDPDIFPVPSNQLKRNQYSTSPVTNKQRKL